MAINPVMAWLIICILLLFIETVTFNLVTIWFAVGALAAMLVSVLGLGPLWQIGLFALVSGVMLYFTRPVAKKIIKAEPTNADMLIGKTGVVTDDIDNVKGVGEVKVDGRYWTARAIDEMGIEKGAHVVIVAISGVKLMVRRK